MLCLNFWVTLFKIKIVQNENWDLVVGSSIFNTNTYAIASILNKYWQIPYIVFWTTSAIVPDLYHLSIGDFWLKINK